jgi:hypothetical protein
VTDTGTTVFFNPFEPGFREDPYPFYRRILDESPVQWVVPNSLTSWLGPTAAIGRAGTRHQRVAVHVQERALLHDHFRLHHRPPSARRHS